MFVCLMLLLLLLLPLQEVFKPTLQYLKAEQYDAARTNTNYITKYFNIKKKIDSLIVQASDLVDDPDTVSESCMYVPMTPPKLRNSLLMERS